MEPVGRLSAVTVDCLDPVRLAAFWSAVLGGPVEEPLPGWRRVRGPAVALTFQPVPEPKAGKVRLHLDVTVDDVARAVERIAALGGRWSGERHDYPEGAVLVMADPEGHEFCIVQYY
jgi:predicted enzyme related to lactoylglutathione lyase